MRRMALIFCAALLLVASPVWAAAKIVNVRVGHHPEYDRIVFDLDGWAAYQVHSISGNEIVLRVLAGAEPTQINTEKGLVRSVQVTPSGERSEVRIRLRTADVRVKDSTLQSPARIVIDVRKSATATAKAAPKPKVAQKTPAPAPAVKKAPVPAPKPVEKAPVVAKPAPVPTPVPAPAPVMEEVVAVQPKEDPAAKQPTQEDVAKKSTATAAAKAPPVSRTKPAPVKKQAARAPAPAAPANALDIRLVGGGILMLLVGIGGFVWKRRRSASVEDGDEADAIEGDWFAAGGAGANAVEAAPEESSPVAPEAEDLPASRAGASEAPLFGSDSPAAPPTLDRVAPVTSLDSVVGSSSPSNGGSGMSEAQFQELQEQIKKIEGRLSDFEAARERLEQQGVNQTEELRVQRAAIARTQRVLRSITRTEDDGSADAGTPGE
jgi:hypothetical protein